MASYEHKSKKLCVITENDEPKNRMFSDKIYHLKWKAEVPVWMQELNVPPKQIMDIVNPVLTGRAYLNRRYGSIGPFRRGNRYGYYIFFEKETDAMAFKLMWGE